MTAFARDSKLENLIAIENTSSDIFLYHYKTLIQNGFSLVASSKAANIIKLLHLSGENITRIQGVFSGSLSYIFNNYSSNETEFSQVLQEAITKGFTEPDPREDLCGNDVARKLLILARELDLHNEMADIKIANLIPEELRHVNKSEFLNTLERLNPKFTQLKKEQSNGHVLRYVGDLSGDLSKVDGAILDVKLISVPTNSPLGALKGSDSLFEIYTESYGDNPIVIQGAGAGASVTARGVFGDILRLAQTNH